MSSNKNHKFFKYWKQKYFKKNVNKRNISNIRKTNFGTDSMRNFVLDSNLSKKNETKTKSDCPYKGWKLYFFDHDYDENSPTVAKVRAVEQFLKAKPDVFVASEVEKSLNFSLDVNLLYDDAHVRSQWPNFEDDLRNNPNHTLSCIGLAVHQMISMKMLQENEVGDAECEGDIDAEVPMIQIRITNFKPVLQLKNLKSNYIGKLITVKGTVIKIGSVKLMCTWMAFQCDSCETVQTFKQIDGVCSFPSSCGDSECRSKAFTPLFSSPLTKTLNWQCIRLQEIINDENREGGRVPRTIDCELVDDLVDSCAPGDVAFVTGIIKIKNNEVVCKHKSSNIFHQYMDVISIINGKELQKDGIPGIEFSQKNYYGIKEIFSENNLFSLIVHSLCPAIFGHEMVKAGLVLAMFGGCQRYEDGRANAHVLIVGDPGLGKSRLLQACASAAPRGVYVCGNTSTISGLTVTLTRESGGDYSLEAGALVLADQGCCCIDEFDKMSSQHQALLEAMEQQTVSIAKSGVVCGLPCRVSVLAAANPVGGHYNQGKTVSENLNLGPSLLSRFDLVFILIDEPSVAADSLLSDHVMAMHSKGKTNISLPNPSPSLPNEEPQRKARLPLTERLKAQQGEELDLIPHQLLRKYIAYAKQYVKPRLTEEASETLMKFYMELRKNHGDWQGAPVTPRQLESLIRFTEARAKLELREEATASDAEDVVDIFKHSFLNMFANELDDFKFDMSQNVVGKSRKTQTNKFLMILKRKADIAGKNLFTFKELRELAESASIAFSGDFSDFLSTLNAQGYLLKKGSQLYQLIIPS